MKLGIFGKLFLYTLTFLIVTIGVTAIMFAGQFKALYENSQRQIFRTALRPLVNDLEGKSSDEMKIIVSRFHEENPEFNFAVVTSTENILFGGKTTPEEPNTRYHLSFSMDGDSVAISAYGNASDNIGYKAIIQKIVLGLSILILLGVLGAALFARGMSEPIKRLAGDTHKMAALLPAERPPIRYDELGQLEQDVYDMYDKLKKTITELEREDENQRYFFSAASHELKTPIAAVNALLEGMLANIGDYKDHPKYLRECIKMNKAQNKIVSEILEIVNITGGKIKPDIEKINLCGLIEDILPEYRTLAESAGIGISIRLPDNTICLADKNMLGRSVSNILMNAVQNTPTGGEIRIFSSTVNENSMRLSVINTNSHIEDEIADRIFEPFFREDKVRGRAQGRSGLGLNIVKKMLDSMEIPFCLRNIEEDVEFYMDIKIH